MSWPFAALAAFVGFSALIMLHELGHFAAAKAVGMRVEKFSLFFGPMLVKVRRGETTYGIGPIPLGGYVRITGMNPNEELPPEVAARGFFRQPVWKRVVVIGAGPFMSILTAFVILFGVYAVNGTRELTTQVGAVEPGWPAAGVFRPGDKLVAVDGRRGDAEAISKAVARHRCADRPPVDGCNAATPARLTFVRHGVTRTVTLLPRYDALTRKSRVGFSYREVRHDFAASAAARESLSTMRLVITKTASTFAGIFTSAQKRKQVSSVVGAYESTRQSFELSFAQAMFLLGVVSLSLGVINLFPFLPLDGGHIFFALAEKIRGRAIPFSVMERASVVGIMLVLFVFIIGFSNDIGRLTGQGFGVR
jgi:regulator of sigma E protease